jgi:hypothetical protein
MSMQRSWDQSGPQANACMYRSWELNHLSHFYPLSKHKDGRYSEQNRESLSTSQSKLY